MKRMLVLLTDFYSSRSVSYDKIITVRGGRGHGGFWLLSIGGDIIPVLLPSLREKKTRAYRKEMRAFAAFLKVEFFYN